MPKTTYACAACGFSSPQWFGRCPGCGEWSTVGRAAPTAAPTDAATATAVSSLATLGPAPDRLVSGISDLDRVLGGGFVPGAVVLLAGEPGIGKSTLVLQMIDGLLTAGRTALVATGEESLDQVGRRARRLGVAVDRFRAAASTDVTAIVAAARAEAAEVVVVDSVQALAHPDVPGPPGSVVQVRECAAALVRHAKETGTVVVIVGHVTKEGTVAGPKTLEHVVDAVLVLEGERSGTLRLLRASKNRFGACDETGVFLMDERGLEVVDDASAMLLSDRRSGITGSVVFPSLEGTRPVLVEIQALIPSETDPQPRRVASGVDARRIALLLGILSGRAGMKFANKDVFVAAAGGLTVREPAADLPTCLALFSASEQLPIHERLVAMGEIGLGGEVRRVPGCERRLAEAARLGFEIALVPPGLKRSPPRLRCVEVSDIVSAFDAAAAARLSRAV